MQREKIEIVKAILTSKYWLLFSLAGVFFCFFARGSGANFFLNLTGIFLVIELLLGNYRIKQIPRWYLVVAAICAYLVLASVLNPYAYSKVRYIKRLMRMVIVVFAIHCLSQKEIEDRIILLLTTGMLAVAVCWQFAARNFQNMSYGTYDNPHYLAGFAVLALPLIVYFFSINKGWSKLLFISVGILDVVLILQIGSRPAFWTMACVALFVFIFLSKGWYRWLGIMLLFSIITVLYITDYPVAMASDARLITLKDLIRKLATEERIQLWKDAWKMQQDNSLLAWIVGNGIGSSLISLPKYMVPRYSGYIDFPHNFFLEVLYENGIVGFVLIFGGLGFLFFAAIIKARKEVNKNQPALLKCMIALLLIWFIYCGLVFPFYSNYTLIPLAFILGTMLVLLEKIPSAEVVDLDGKGKEIY